MSLLSRINNVARAIKTHRELFTDAPGYESWDNKKLYEYIISYINKLHADYKINSFKDAQSTYSYYLKKESLSKEAYDLLLKAEKIFFDEAAKSDSFVFFIDPAVFYED